MAKRFVVNECDITKEGENINITGSEVQHIKALRKEVGCQIEVNEYVVEIQSISKKGVQAKIIKKAQSKGVPKKNITLIQSYLKSDKMDYVVQKAVELGVKSIQPVISKNTVVKLDTKDYTKKQDRLDKIAKEAIGQCGRTDEVKINSICKLEQVNFEQYNLVLLCFEKGEVHLKQVEEKILHSNNIAVIIGPEGGFSDQEVEKILNGNENVISVIFGERILRAETASMYILSVLEYI